MTLEIHGAARAAAAGLEALCLAAWVLDSRGRVLAMTRKAEALVGAASHLRLHQGRLCAVDEERGRALAAAVVEAATATEPRTLAVRDASGAEPMALEVAPLPTTSASCGGVLVVARTPRNEHARVAALAQALFGLTPAEATVAAHLAAGAGPQAVARLTGVGVGTVRTHVRRIFEKARVNSLVELVAALGARL